MGGFKDKIVSLLRQTHLNKLFMETKKLSKPKNLTQSKKRNKRNPFISETNKNNER